MPEAEVVADGDCLGADRREVRLDELLGRQPHELGRERRDERLGDTGLREELQAPLERRDQLDAVPERDPRVRLERDHRRVEPRVDGRAQDGEMTAVDAVERADRDRARPTLELDGRVGDPHRAPPPSRGSASSSGSTTVSSASSTPNGPISVRRRLVQWPPSASAIERT